MKKFLALITLLCVSQWSHAERYTSQQPIICDQASVVMQELKEKYKEIPIWMGNSTAQQNVQAFILANNETLSWTMLLTNGQVACVLTVGEGFQMKLPDSTKPKS